MPLANDTLLPHEFWAATGMAAWRAALDMTTSVANASAALMGGAPAAAPTTASRLAVARAEPAEQKPEYRARSWYKAPYRSPFDPLFWMSPGHPIDHMDDWINLLRNVSSTVPGFPAAFTPPIAPPAATAAPFLYPWLSLMETMGRTFAPSLDSGANDNIVDFASAYANYRTAGGHAVAQIFRGGSDHPATTSPSASGTASTPLPFPMALFLPIWMR